jgi:hypothetical protein
MKYPHSLLVLCTALVLSHASAAWAANSIEPDQATPVIQIELNAGLLTLKTEAAPLHEVLNRVGELAGFTVVRIADSGDPQLVNVSFESLPVEQLVARLVDNSNRIIFYAQAGDGSQGRVISQIWLLGPGNADIDYDEKSVIYNDDLQQADSRKRSEAALRLSQQSVPGLSEEDSRGKIISRLGRLLHEDHDALVRSRAAIALGGLNDQRAVADLEAALLDENSTVRSQAITALGRIGGETATMALGNILLDGTGKAVDRIMAAQALWKHDSESARAYLRAGTNDLDEQVRQASGKAPSSISNELSEGQLGPEESE